MHKVLHIARFFFVVSPSTHSPQAQIKKSNFSTFSSQSNLLLMINGG